MGKGKQEAGGVLLSKGMIAALAVVGVLLIAGGVLLGLNWDRWFGSGNTVADGGTSESGDSEGFNPDIDTDAADWDGTIAGDTEAYEESVGIKIPGYPSITIPADEETVSVALVNPEGNPCYFTFTIVLKDTEEVLYTSGLVPPGQAITSITLSSALEAGEYDAVIQITTTSLEDGSAMNGANVETVLIAQ